MAAPPPDKAARLDPEALDATRKMPDGILACIFSRLPLRSAVLCGFVSKAWEKESLEMLSKAPELDLGSEFAQGLSRETYCRLVDKILDLNEAKLLNSVKFFYLLRQDDDLGRVDNWLGKVASKGAAVVELELLIDHPLELKPPECWKCLTCLSLFDISEDLLQDDDEDDDDDADDDDDDETSITVDLQTAGILGLQMLYLRSVKVDSVLDEFIKHCPKLSTVKLVECDGLEGFRISSKKLCTLEFIKCCTGEGSVFVNTPELRSLHFDGVASEIVLEDVANLEDAYIRSEYGHGGDWLVLCNLVHVTILTSSDAPLEDILEEHDHPPLAFNNLKSLQIVMDRYKDMEGGYLKLLCNFLQFCSFPVLEDLFIEFPPENIDGASEVSIPVAPLSNLRLVCIKGYEDLGNQFKLVEFLLESAVTLETLVLYMNDKTSNGRLAELQDEIEALPTAREGLTVLLGRDGDHLVGVPPLPHAEFRREISEYYNELGKASKVTLFPW